MKHIQIITLSLLLLCPAGRMQAQSPAAVEVSGTVVDTQGRPVEGAQVRGAGGAIATADAEGIFALVAPAGSPLSVSALGYQSQQIESGSAARVTLIPDTEQINLAFRSVAPKDVTGGVAWLNIPEQLEKVNFYSGGENLTEMLPGFGNGAVWGMGGLLTLVDGVPRDLGNIMASEIQQITLLKGASAVALYGSRAAKGALLITTKRGVSHENRIEVRGNTSIATPKIFPDYLGSAEYMTLYNEALANDGMPALYSDQDIYNHASGLNPYRYPSVDYYSDEYMRQMSTRTDATAEFTGGNDKALFYADLGFYNTNSLLKVGEGANDRYNRFHVRGNVDVKINRFLTGKINTSLAFYNTSLGRGNYWSQAATLRPNRYAPLIPIEYLEQTDRPSWDIVDNSPFLIDGKYLLGGTQLQTTNPFSELYTQGPNQYRARQFQFDASVNADLNSFVEGLSFSTQFAVDYYSRFNQTINNNTYAVYAPIWTDYAGESHIASLTQYGENKVSRGRALADTYQYQNLFLSAQLDYRRTFGADHNVSAILLAHGYQRTISGEYHRFSNANLGLLASYNYRHRYYLDFAASAVHSSKLPKSNRTALSPTLTLGWRLTGEKFLADSRVVDELMLTVSGGVLNTDLDIANYYMYEPVWDRFQNTYFQWQEGRQNEETRINQGANPNLDYIRRKEISAGLDASLFEGLIRLNASWFYTRMDGLVIADNNAYPGFFTSDDTNLLPYINSDNNLYTGFDFGASFHKRIGAVDFDLGVVGAYFVPEAAKRTEIYEDKYQSHVGRPINSHWGLVSDGLFQNQAEIDAHASQSFGEVRAGDIRYVDQNNDGVVNAQDEVWLGHSTSPFYYGINLTARWKSLTFFAQASGRAGGQGIKNSTYYHVYGDRKYSAVVRDRTVIGSDAAGDWEVVRQGSFPRLTTQSGSNNFRNSDYWLYDNDAIALSRVQISYELPSRLFADSFVKGMNVYLSGYDLLTFAKEREVLEMNIGAAPQTRSFNAGVKITF